MVGAERGLRLLLRLALLHLSLMAVLLLLICARRYDGRTVTEFFAESCVGVMPCWQGIRPGVTTYNQALALLRAHPWVNQMSEVYASPQASAGESATILIFWTWSERYPFGGSASPQGIIVTDQSIVVQIYLTADLSIGDLWLALGGAQGGSVVTGVDNTPLHFDHTAFFTHKGVAATAQLRVDCADPYPNFWRVPVYMWLRNNLELPSHAMSAPAYLRELWSYYPRLHASLC